MDLWTEDVQEALLGLLGTVLAIVLTWLAAKAASYLKALEAKAIEAAGEIADGRLTAAAEQAIRYVEQWAARQINATGAQKLAAAKAVLGKWFPEADEDDLEAVIEAALNGLKNGWKLEPEPLAAGPVDTIGRPIVATVPPALSTAVEQAQAASDALSKQIEAARASADAKVAEFKGLAESFGLPRDGDA